MTSPAVRVVKVGGSLFELPDLAERLRRWFEENPAKQTVIVSGGGTLVDTLRKLCRQSPLDEQTAHWLAIDLMSVTARLLHARMPELALVDNVAAVAGTCLLDASKWLRYEEPQQPGRKLAENWQVTSDSIAARLADCLGADELVLLKSSLPERPHQLKEIASTGFVDPLFAEYARALDTVRLVNLRSHEFDTVALS